MGTNGNLSISGNVDIYGNLYTPRTGVGTCEEGAVTALTETGHADVFERQHHPAPDRLDVSDSAHPGPIHDRRRVAQRGWRFRDDLWPSWVGDARQLQRGRQQRHHLGHRPDHGGRSFAANH